MEFVAKMKKKIEVYYFVAVGMLLSVASFFLEGPQEHSMLLLLFGYSVMLISVLADMFKEWSKRVIRVVLIVGILIMAIAVIEMATTKEAQKQFNEIKAVELSVS